MAHSATRRPSMRLPKIPGLLAALVLVALPILTLSRATRSATEERQVVPSLDRVIVVIMENKSYNVARIQPYTAELLNQGVTFTQSYAVTHPSQPNYMAL